jgi:hypothetical protein
MIKITLKIYETKTMLKKLFIYSLYLFEITICMIYFEHGSLKIPNFSWIPTICIPTYGGWTNLYNNAILYEFSISPYHEVRNCWVREREIRFTQTYIDNFTILEIYLILLCLNIILKKA